MYSEEMVKIHDFTSYDFYYVRLTLLFQETLTVEFFSKKDSIISFVV